MASDFSFAEVTKSDYFSLLAFTLERESSRFETSLRFRDSNL